MNDHLINEPERAAALALLRDAVGANASVTAAESGAAYDVVIGRDGNAPLHFRLRYGDADTNPSPHDVRILTRPGKAELQRLRERAQNFVALNGAVRLVNGWLLLDREGLHLRRPREAGTRKRTDPFADRNSLIARTLLAHPGREWGVRELAAAAGVAVGTASQVVAALTRAGALRFEQRGRNARTWLEDPWMLMRMWFAAYTWERNEQVAFHAPMGDPVRFVRRLPEVLTGTRWALTLQAGASLVAPHATWERIHAYVDVARRSELLLVGRALGWTPAEDGQIVLMKPYYRTSVWNDEERVGGVPVVSVLQLVLDLWDYPLRGREQAEHLLATTLRIPRR